MEGSMIDLSKYRFQSAKEDLETAQLLMKDGRFKASVNRSYYAIFHGLRSVTPPARAARKAMGSMSVSATLDTSLASRAKQNRNPAHATG